MVSKINNTQKPQVAFGRASLGENSFIRISSGSASNTQIVSKPSVDNIESDESLEFITNDKPASTQPQLRQQPT